MLSALQETLNEGIALPASVAQAANQKASSLNTMKRLKTRLALGGWRGHKRRDLALKKLALAHWREQLHENQPQHAYAETIARAFPEEWAAFSKFCVVRNPWTKTVSDYFWRIKNNANPPSFEEFVRAIERGDPMGDIVRVRYHDNWPLYTIDDQIVSDHVIRFEHLTAGLTETCAALKIPFDGWLPRAKGSHRPKSGANGDPFSFYTPELRDTVGRLYEKEITTFGYTFNPATA